MSTSFDGREMTDKPKARASGGRYRWWRFLGIVVLGLIVLGFTMPCFPRPAKRGLMTLQFMNLKQVMPCFKMYSGDNRNPPKALAEIAASQKYVTTEVWSEIGKYKSPVTKKQIDWLYFPERYSLNGERSVILASPESYKGDRLVGWSDGSCQIMPEDEFAQINARGGKLEAPK